MATFAKTHLQTPGPQLPHIPLDPQLSDPQINEDR